MEPPVRALDMPRITMLIADDVGLGKTTEAGLIVQELHLRHRMRTCLVRVSRWPSGQVAGRDVDAISASSPES